MEYNLADIFEGVVDAIPDRTALVCGDRRLTYRELERRANRVAHVLADAGIGKDDHVGLQLHNSTEYLETVLGALKIRAVPVNVNYRYVAEELRYLYDDADLKALVFGADFGDRVVEAAKDIDALHTFLVVGDAAGATLPEGAREFEDAVAGASGERDFEGRSGDDLYIIYTGGTTGMPKGVMWRHEDLFFAGLGGGNPRGEDVSSPEEVVEIARSSDELVTCPAAPLIHGAAQLASFISWNMGQKVVLQPRYDPDDLVRLIDEEKINTISLVGDAMARPLADALERNRNRYDTSALFVISTAGAIMSETTRDRLQSLLPNTMILDSFGASETGFQGMATADSSPDKGLKFTMNERTLVLDDDLKPIEPGSGKIGRVAQRGRVPLGYYGDEEKTRQTFVEIDGDRYVVLGDMGTVEADGSVSVFGRGNVCINTGGEKVYPEEVEAALKSHPAVYDAVVAGIPDEQWGQKVGAVVQLSGDDRPSEAEIEQHVRSKVAGYKVPRVVQIVDEIVRSPSGKADYRWARETLAKGVNA